MPKTRAIYGHPWPKRKRQYIWIGANNPDEPRSRHPDDGKPHTRVRREGLKFKEQLRAQS